MSRSWYLVSATEFSILFIHLNVDYKAVIFQAVFDFFFLFIKCRYKLICPQLSWFAYKTQYIIHWNEFEQIFRFLKLLG